LYFLEETFLSAENYCSNPDAILQSNLLYVYVNNRHI